MMRLGLRVLLGLSIVALPILGAAPASADGCALGDLTCLTQSVGGTVDDTVGQVGGTAGGAVGTANDTVGGIVGTVHHIIDVTVPPPPQTGGTDPTGGSGDTGGSGGSHPGHRSDLTPGSRHPGGGVPGPNARTGRSVATSVPLPAATSLNVASDPDRRTQGRTTIGRLAAEVAAGALALMVVGALMFGFLLVQDRLDRRDPRLAPSSSGSDRVAFG